MLCVLRACATSTLQAPHEELRARKLGHTINGSGQHDICSTYETDLHQLPGMAALSSIGTAHFIQQLPNSVQ